MNDTDLMKAEESAKSKLPIATEALAITVKDTVSLSYANQAYLLIDLARKEIKDYFNPIVEAWKESKRKADEGRALTLQKWEKAEEPLVRARAYLDGQIVEYKREQDRIRQEQEELLRQKAIKEEMERRKAEEEARLAQAAELEKAGAKEEAEQIIQETIEAQAEPVQVYIPPAPTPKVELSGMTTETRWHAEVFDLRALCKAIGEGKTSVNFVEANLPALNKQATSLQKEMRIPGVRGHTRDENEDDWKKNILKGK